MGTEHLKILIGDREAAHAEAISQALSANGKSVEIRVAQTLGDYGRYVEECVPDVVLIDLDLSDGRVMEVLTSPPENGEFPILVMTSHGNERVAVEALKAGAMDYIVKSPEAFAAMPRVVERALKEWRLLQDHKSADRIQRASLRFLQTVHKHAEIKPLLDELASEIKEFTGCDSVAIRVLDQDGNIPYHAYKGFSTKFVEMESPLSVKKDKCMCINVVKEATDPRLSFYTKGGSFYMNATTRFLATVSEAEKGQTRNVCNSEGYESVALVPFRSGGRVLGLIHVADHRENMVPLSMIEQLESLALQLGTFFQRANAVHALKESEEKYRASEHQYRQLVDNALVGVYRSTPEGKFLYVNDALARIFECDNAHEMMMHPVEMWYRSSEDRQAFLSILKERGKVPYYEIEVPTKFGKVKNIVISAVLEDGFITGMVTDVTERRHLEAQLLHAQKMEAIGTLAGGIAHDFNNLLNVILGFGTMVMDIIRDDRIASEHLNEVLAAAEKAENLTKRLLLFGRKEVAEFKAVDVNGTVNNVAKILSRIIGEDIRLVMNLMRERALVMADAGQMEQVLMNLATNARDAMPEGGTLTIGTELRAIDDLFAGAYYDVPGTFVVISVTDTGTGIREEDKSRIFDPFFTTKPVDKGTGLGLSIAYGIIKQHSGYLKVYSEQGKGATFQIWLPLIEDAVEEKPAVQVLSLPKGGTETILVAEDDASMRKLTRIVLERYGYHVIMAEDGEDAVKKFAGNKEEIRLVMLDMIMPKKGGREAYEEIREMAPRTRTLFLSGYTAHEGSARELTAEGFDFIYKPVLPEDLLRKVREILDRP